jgi:hypothetical protein
MKKIWEQYQHIIIIAVLTIAVIAVIWYWAYHSGKKYVPKDVELPGDTSSGGTTFNPRKYTDAIADDLYTYLGALSHSATPYLEANKLSNSQLAAVWNDWNHRYFEKHNEDLMQAIQADSGIDTVLYTSDWVIATRMLKNRLKSIPGIG